MSDEKKQILVREGWFYAGEGESYLIGSRCGSCGYVSFPKRLICPACLRENTMEEIPLSRKGQIYSYTVQHIALPGFQAPYVVARVELPEGPKIYSLITGCKPVEGALEIGDEVELVIGKIKEDEKGNEVIGYLFRPVA